MLFNAAWLSTGYITSSGRIDASIAVDFDVGVWFRIYKASKAVSVHEGLDVSS